MDYDELKASLEQLEMLCTQVNEAVRSKENTEQLEWLQTHVQFTLDEVGHPYTHTHTHTIHTCTHVHTHLLLCESFSLCLSLFQNLVFNSQTNFMGSRKLLHWGKLFKVRVQTPYLSDIPSYWPSSSPRADSWK